MEVGARFGAAKAVMQQIDDLPRGTRIYLSRKRGKEIYDAELWLDDGRRIAWRTGQLGRDAARAAARQHLLELLSTSASRNGALTTGLPIDSLPAPIPPALPIWSSQDSVDTIHSGFWAASNCSGLTPPKWLCRRVRL
jgi:hypothetical protein